MIRKAIGGLFWGYNKPGCFMLARVEDDGRVYVMADIKWKGLSVEEASERILGLAAAHKVRLTATFADKELSSTPGSYTGLLAPSIAATFRRHGVNISTIGGDIEHGWQRVRDFMRASKLNRPWLVVSPDAKVLIRTISTVVQVKTNPDDCEGETYAVHALRVLLSSRPMPWKEEPKKPEPKYGTLGYYKKLQRRPSAGVLVALAPSGAVRRHG